MASFWNSILASRPGQSGEQFRSAIGRLRGHAAFWLKALSQPSIDLSLRTHAGLSTRIVESPGLSLSEAELEARVQVEAEMIEPPLPIVWDQLAHPQALDRFRRRSGADRAPSIRLEGMLRQTQGASR